MSCYLRIHNRIRLRISPPLNAMLKSLLLCGKYKLKPIYLYVLNRFVFLCICDFFDLKPTRHKLPLFVRYINRIYCNARIIILIKMYDVAIKKK